MLIHQHTLIISQNHSHEILVVFFKWMFKWPTLLDTNIVHCSVVMPCWFSIEQNKYGIVLGQDSMITMCCVAGCTPGVRSHQSSSSQDSGWIRQWLGSGHGSVPEFPQCKQQTAGCSKYAQVRNTVAIVTWYLTQC